MDLAWDRNQGRGQKSGQGTEIMAGGRNQGRGQKSEKNTNS